MNGQPDRPATGSDPVSATYTARLCPQPDHGIRLDPSPNSVLPERPEELNLLALAVAIALGHAGFEHHPEPRVAEIQTLDALLSGEITAPWRAPLAAPGQDLHVRCDRLPTGVWVCSVGPAPADARQ